MPVGLDPLAPDEERVVGLHLNCLEHLPALSSSAFGIWSVGGTAPPGGCADGCAGQASRLFGGLVGGELEGPRVVGLAARRAQDLVDRDHQARQLVAGQVLAGMAVEIVEVEVVVRRGPGSGR